MELSLEHGTQILTQCPRRTIDMPDVRWRTMDAPPHRQPVPTLFPPCSRAPAAPGRWASQCSADRLEAAAPPAAVVAAAGPLQQADWAYAWPRAPMYSAANWCRYAHPGVAAPETGCGAAACVARCRRWHDSASSRNWLGYAALSATAHKTVQSVYAWPLTGSLICLCAPDYSFDYTRQNKGATLALCSNC